MYGWKFFDFLSTTPHLYIFNKKTYQTLIGAILSIIIIVLSVLCLFGFGIDIFYKKKPLSVLSREYVETPVINRSDLMFALNPVFPTGEPIKELKRKLSISMLYVSSNTLNLTKPTSWINVPLINCPDSPKYKNNFLNFTKKLPGNPENAACIPDEFNGNVRGKVGDALSDLYVFYVRYGYFKKK
jgi:hypothetical protein